MNNARSLIPYDPQNNRRKWTQNGGSSPRENYEGGEVGVGVCPYADRRTTRV